MSAPVWVLSVDLQTKTATFQTGLADAARSARGAFSDIKGGASEMGGAVSYSTMEARHSVMMLGQEFGVHLPRSLTTFISSLSPLGPALEMAFPFLAIALGVTLLLEHLSKLHEAGAKLTEDQDKFRIAANDAFNSMDEKILQAEKRADELKGDHLGALKYELELIDKQSMDQLVTEFAKVAKAADTVFGRMESHWYSMGIGSAGAKNALDQFQAQYDLLMSEGKAEQASGLLGGTLKQAQLGLDMMKQFKDNQSDSSTGKKGDYNKAVEAADALRKMGLMSKLSGEFTAEEAKSQQTLVDALTATVHLQQQSATLTGLNKGNAKTDAHKKDGKDAAALAKLLAEAGKKVWMRKAASSGRPTGPLKS